LPAASGGKVRPRCDKSAEERLPVVKRVAVLSDALAADQLKQVVTSNQSVGFELQSIHLENPPYDFESAFRAARRSDAEAIFVLESASIFRGRELIVRLAMENRLPTSFAFREYVEVGGLVSCGVNFSKMYRRAAEYTDKILHGAKPADLPVEQSTKFDLVINLKTAKALAFDLGCVKTRTSRECTELFSQIPADVPVQLVLHRRNREGSSTRKSTVSFHTAWTRFGHRTAWTCAEKIATLGLRASRRDWQ
jgi:ABC transporter substrate binding protein